MAVKMQARILGATQRSLLHSLSDGYSAGRVSHEQHGTFVGSVSHGQRKGYTEDFQETWFGALPFAGTRRSDEAQDSDSGSDRIRPCL